MPPTRSHSRVMRRISDWTRFWTRRAGWGGTVAGSVARGRAGGNWGARRSRGLAFGKRIKRRLGIARIAAGFTPSLHDRPEVSSQAWSDAAQRRGENAL